MEITHFTLAELCHSDTAEKEGIQNIPTFAAVANLKLLTENLLEPLRSLVGKPIHINNGYRNYQLNIAVGGVKTSQHLLGMAVDIYVVGYTVRALFDLIRFSDLQYCELIEEHDWDKGTHWIHISYSVNNNKRQNLIMTRKNGKTTYVEV